MSGVPHKIPGFEIDITPGAVNFYDPSTHEPEFENGYVVMREIKPKTNCKNCGAAQGRYALCEYCGTRH